jgi:hypothetical protein
VIDLDHACYGDPAIDLAPLIGAYGSAQVADIAEPVEPDRAMRHRATLPPQVAAADSLGRTDLRDHALTNFTTRLTAGTLHDPQGAQPST